MKREKITGPRQNVRIALFALSGNQCAFPGCDASMFEEETVLGEICHIHAQSPGGPRYKEDLSDEEVHAIGNLVLLCQKQHKIVDDHPEQYDAAWLRKVKADHESRVATMPSGVLQRLVEALAPEVPDNWWERPSAPIFKLSLASSRPAAGPWTYEIDLEQVDGGDIGNLRFSYRVGDSECESKVPTLKDRRKWRLETLTLQPRGERFDLNLRFWWGGSERCVTYRWETEEAFQNTEPTKQYS